MKGKKKPCQSLEEWHSNCMGFQIGWVCLWLVVFISLGSFDIIFGGDKASPDSASRQSRRTNNPFIDGLAGLWDLLGWLVPWLGRALVEIVKVTALSLIPCAITSCLLYGILCLIYDDRPKALRIMTVVAWIFCGVMVYELCCRIFH